MEVSWYEHSHEDAIIVVAEQNGLSWQFFERSSWEIRWFPRASSPSLIARAEAALTRAPEASICTCGRSFVDGTYRQTTEQFPAADAAAPEES
jgi:hypothetical protein